MTLHIILTNFNAILLDSVPVSAGVLDYHGILPFTTIKGNWRYRS